MLIQNIGNQNVFGAGVQDANLQKVVNLLNANVAKKQNFDVVELSKKAQELLKESDDVQEKEPVIDYENSELVHSTRWGTHSKAEFAQMSLSYQRNDLKTMADQIEHAKSKLAFTVGKMAELENFLAGTSAHSDPNMTRETAETYLHNYEQSIATDYADFHIGRDQYNADEFDKLSGGLASDVFENPLHALNAETLGLANLQGSPDEIMKALENASNIIDKLTIQLESAFKTATGGVGFSEPARSFSALRGDSSLDFFVSRMETGYKIVSVDSGLGMGGETLKIDLPSVSDLEEAQAISMR